MRVTKKHTLAERQRIAQIMQIYQVKQERLEHLIRMDQVRRDSSSQQQEQDTQLDSQPVSDTPKESEKKEDVDEDAL